MTRHKRAHTGLVTPSLPQLLLTDTLRLFAMLVSNVASTLQIIRRRPAERHSDATPTALPREKTDTRQQEETPVTASEHDDDREIIITNPATPTGSFSGLSRESRLAQYSDRQLMVPLLTLRVEPQAKAGTQSGKGTRENIFDQHMTPWVPPYAGMSGERTRKTAPA